jgi:hypothetical protein
MQPRMQPQLQSLMTAVSLSPPLPTHKLSTHPTTPICKRRATGHACRPDTSAALRAQVLDATTHGSHRLPLRCVTPAPTDPHVHRPC